MESFALFLAIVIAAISIAWPFLWLRRRQIKNFVNRWAKENDYELVKYEEKLISPFTFSLKKSRSQEVVLVEIKDHDGKHKKCWLKLGGYLSGLFSYKAECKWVD